MTVQFFIVVLGVATVLLSCWAAHKFHVIRNRRSKDSRRLSTAITLQLLGEAVIGMGTLAFSIAAATGWLHDWSDNLQSCIRFIMFFCTSSTTYHLLRTSVTLEGE